MNERQKHHRMRNVSKRFRQISISILQQGSDVESLRIPKPCTTRKCYWDGEVYVWNGTK